MKIYRLIGIITVLQQKGSVTMPELARRFEVSRRTIARDLDEINQAGIPIVTSRGAGGGISLMEGFSLDTTVFTSQEMDAILTGLQSLQSVSETSAIRQLVQKLGGETDKAGHMSIDLSSFYKSSHASKLALLDQAITQHRRVRFRYYAPQGTQERTIEPYRIVYQWSDWYIFGFCLMRQDYRLFKLRRLWYLQLEEQSFQPRAIPEEKTRFGTNMTDDRHVKAVYHPSVQHRLVEEYGPDCFTVGEDGMLYTDWGFTTDEDAIRFFLSFGDRVRVLSPDEMVQKMRQMLSAMQKNYET